MNKVDNNGGAQYAELLKDVVKDVLKAMCGFDGLGPFDMGSGAYQDILSEAQTAHNIPAMTINTAVNEALVKLSEGLFSEVFG